MNILDRPLYWLGISLGIWLFAEIVLKIFLPSVKYGHLFEITRPILAVAGPAAVGYWTNWLVIKMLFHPRRQNAIWWGLVPARRGDLSEIIAEEVVELLISPEIIQSYLEESGLLSEIINRASVFIEGVIKDSEFQTEVKALAEKELSRLMDHPATRAKVKNFLQIKINEWRGQSLNEKFIEWSKGIWGPIIIEEIDKIFSDAPRFLEEVYPEVESSLLSALTTLKDQGKVESAVTKGVVKVVQCLGVKGIIKSQLDKLNEEELEAAIIGNTQTELVFIQTSGGIFGLIVGVAILFPMLRIIFLLVAVALWLIYRLTVEKE